MFIQNVSMQNIQDGWHYDAGPNSMLIQIVGPDMKHPDPKYPFKEIYKYKFLDIEDGSPEGPLPHHALSIVENLKHAKENHMNVIVHCVAGICRSGAVVAAGVFMGFEDTGTYRQPNLLLKHLLFKEI